MTYTYEMGRAFSSLQHFCPKDFGVAIIDHDNFLSVKANEQQFLKLNNDNKRRAVEYMVRVKSALEQNGAIVLLVREAVE
jgi:hypothetical protein